MATLYHGSTVAGIRQFYPMSHFGTLESALAVAAAKSFETVGGGVDWAAKATAFLYTVEVDLDTPSRMTVNDFGGAGIAHLIAHLEPGVDDVTESAMNELHGMRKLLLELKRRKLLGDDIKSAAAVVLSGILLKDVFEYRNDVEALGSTSFAIAQPSKVNVLSEQRLTQVDLERGWMFLSEHRKAGLSRSQ